MDDVFLLLLFIIVISTAFLLAAAIGDVIGIIIDWRKNDTKRDL